MTCLRWPRHRPNTPAGASLPVDLAADEMALLTEMVVDRGVNRGCGSAPKRDPGAAKAKYLMDLGKSGWRRGPGGADRGQVTFRQIRKFNHLPLVGRGPIGRLFTVMG